MEKILYESKPSGKVIVTWLFSRLLIYLVIFLFFWYFISIIRWIFGFSYTKIFNILVVLFVVIFLYLILLWKTYNYKITDKGVNFSGGIIIRKQKFVPFFKITNVEITQNLIEQMLGISRIGFQTAGTGGQPIPEIVFEGLENTEKPKHLVYKFIEKKSKSAK